MALEELDLIQFNYETLFEYENQKICKQLTLNICNTHIDRHMHLLSGIF
jgi:hypothetical protein